MEETTMDNGAEILSAHSAQVGSLLVRRSLPQRRRRTVGAWCFADHMGPADVTEGSGLDIGPHPHMGLQTVTWLIDGQALHRDSLGSEQVIAAGELNLMTAGHGVSHAEEATGHYRGTLQGIQLWIAQGDDLRGDAAGFEHHADLPHVEFADGAATVLVGQLGDARSPARCDHDLVGADLRIKGTVQLPLQSTYEYGAIVLDGLVELEGRELGPGTMAYLRPGRDATQRPREDLVDGDPPRRRAPRDRDLHVVELRGAHARRDRRGLRLVAQRRRALRYGRFHPGARRDGGALLESARGIVQPRGDTHSSSSTAKINSSVHSPLTNSFLIKCASQRIPSRSSR